MLFEKNVFNFVEISKLFLAELFCVYFQEKDYGLKHAKGRGRKAQHWDVT